MNARPYLAIRMIVGVIAASLLYLWLFDSAMMSGSIAWTAASTAATLRVLGVDIVREGAQVSSPAFSFQIVAECTIVGPMLLYIAGVLAYPARWRSRVSGVVFGFAMIFLLNTIRLVSLFYTGSYWRAAFEEVHLLFWQAAMVLGVVLVWAYWLSKVKAHATSA